MAGMEEFSPYALGLGGQAKKKVHGQVKLIAGLDPFQLASNCDWIVVLQLEIFLLWGPVTLSYLVLQTSFIIEYL